MAIVNVFSTTANPANDKDKSDIESNMMKLADVANAISHAVIKSTINLIPNIEDTAGGETTYTYKHRFNSNCDESTTMTRLRQVGYKPKIERFLRDGISVAEIVVDAKPS